MATPSYLGPGQQPRIAQSWLGQLGSFLGGSGTPQYAGAGQPAPSLGGGFMRGPTPAYAVAPVKEQIADDAPMGSPDDAEEATACPIDPAALAAGQIAIVIPRDRCP